MHRAATLVVALWVALAAAPATAFAHGLGGRADLPVPIDMFYWAAGIALLVSFVGLGLGWKRPLLTNYPWRASQLLTGVAFNSIVGWTGRLVVLALTILVLLSAGFGSDIPSETLAPVMVWVIFWVGVAPFSAVFGNVWRELNPWATIARLTGAPERHPTRVVPPRVGVWPAVAVLVLFVWLELVYPTASNMHVLAIVGTVYSVLTVVAMWRYGREPWLDHGEGFSVYAGLFARLSAIETRGSDGNELHTQSDRRLGWRWPLTGTTRLRPHHGIVALMGVMIGSISFDGFAATTWFKTRLVGWLADAQNAGMDVELTRYLLKSFWLGLFMALAAFFFWLYSELAGRLGRLRLLEGHGGYAGHFAHTLLPIALAYVIAHYFSYFLFQGQLVLSRISDPFGNGSDWFGTAHITIDYTLVGAETIWYTQVVAIVVGHIAGLALAHDRALEMSGPDSRPVISQIPMLGLMLTFTLAGLWFLSEGLS